MGGMIYNPSVEQTFRVWRSPDGCDEGIEELLRDGWQIVSVTGAGASHPTDSDVYFFVVLERRRS